MKFFVVVLAVLAVGFAAPGGNGGEDDYHNEFCHDPCEGTVIIDLGGAVDVAVGAVDVAVGAVGDLVGDLARNLSDLVSSVSAILALVSTGIEILIGGVSQLVESIACASNGIVAIVLNFTALIKCGGNLLIDIGNLIKNVTTALVLLVYSLVKIAEEFLANVNCNVNELLATVDVLLNNLLCAVQELLIKVVATVAKFLNQVSEAVDRALAELQCALRSILEIVDKVLSCLIKKLEELPLKTGSLVKVQCIVHELLCKVAKLADQVIDNVQKALRNLKSTLNIVVLCLERALRKLNLKCDRRGLC